MKNNLLDKKTFTKSTAFISTFLSTLLLAKAAYAGNLMITPSRVELDNKKITQEVQLINKGDTESTYRISFQHLRMTTDGAYEEIKKGNEGKDQFVDDLVRFSPKQVTLKPGEAQTIRLMFKNSPDIKTGEYRSHLLLKEEAPANFGKDVEKKNIESGKISVVLKPLFAISIPVIVRSGTVTANSAIRSLTLGTEKGNKVLYVELARSGNGSTYGNVDITFSPKNSDKKINIGTATNIAIFYPNEVRKVTVPLTLPKNLTLSDGTISVVYQNQQLLAKKTLILDSKNN